MPREKKKKSLKELQRARQNKQVQSQEQHRERMEYQAKHKPRKVPKAKLFVGLLLVTVVFFAYGTWQWAEGQKPPAIGGDTNNTIPIGTAPDFTLQDINGGSVTLSQLKGKIIGIHFMAVGCGGQIYDVNQYQLAQLKTLCTSFCSDKPVSLITVAVATCENSALDAIRRDYGVTWKFGNDYSDQTLDIVNAYVPAGIGDGTVLLIDQEFNIAEIYVGGASTTTLSSRIAELLEA